ncbi:MAG: hypothetical protein J5I93_23895, partial [Pirellulaceae bacterium]|nr:hypothetical protein [Pirellulaceae bacterium]
MLRSYKAFQVAAFILALALLTGCAPTATLLVPQPAATPAVGRGRLAVMELDAPEAHRPLAHRAVCERLGRSGLVPVVDGRELQRFAPWPLHHNDGRLKRDAAIDAARRMGLDSMLVGQVQLLEADGSPYGSKAFRFGNPAVRAVVAYELLDVRSGQVVFDGIAESDEVMLDGESRSSKSQEKALEQLTVQAARRLAERLIPHDQATAVKLAAPAYGAGASRLREGNRAAE